MAGHIPCQAEDGNRKGVGEKAQRKIKGRSVIPGPGSRTWECIRISWRAGHHPHVSKQVGGGVGGRRDKNLHF